MSEEKRGALLDAAVEAVAELGLVAPTARIAKSAGVGDGTLFVYFPTKEQLFNQLYLHIKHDLENAVVIDPHGPVEDGLRQFWDAYIDWGMKFPRKYTAARYLNAWEKLSDETRQAAWAMFPEFRHLVGVGIQGKVLHPQPEEFVGQLIDAIASMVLEHGQGRTHEATEWRDLGWQAFWRSVHA